MVNPEAYAASNALQKCNVAAIVEEFVDELETMNGKCMDIGCGPGDITKGIVLPALDSNAVIIGNGVTYKYDRAKRALLKKSLNLTTDCRVGTDISTDMIQYANEKYGDNVRTAFEVLDIQTRHLPKEYIAEFNHVFSFHALHWCSDIRWEKFPDSWISSNVVDKTMA